ncbi:cation diffusion facilitator family transporter [Sphingomonas sp. LHG3406-1]|uniref:cation diffusion facilitator family transporter n=1 Tax=Sphingomonas sp. LHG3406-1 TaxID=2804617 RepID=UPI0026200EA2|nr:cation diffusion facilitator family transporter [Sphingomonas sp. LHG3406-1]
MSRTMPQEIEQDFARAQRLEWFTLVTMSTVLVVMFMAAGSSQAMRTAWFEDLLSLVPALVFLVAAKLERRPPSRAFPYGFHRVQSLAFLISAVALASVGTFLLFESTSTLLKREHVTIPPVTMFGETLWLGWLMIAALVYSVIPPLILGRLKLPVAQRLQDKVLHTDALMQKADWMTGLAGIAGVLGVGFGYWWADAAASIVIAGSIVHDGVNALRSSTAELIDGAPRKLEKDEIAPEAEELRRRLAGRYPGAQIRLRETGRFINAQVSGVLPEDQVELEALWPAGEDRPWRLAQVSFVPPGAEMTS